MLKSTTTLIIFLLLFNLCQAQHYPHFTMWNRVLVQKKITDRWELSADVHWRTQNSFDGSIFNPLARELMEGYRITTTYKQKEFTFSFAPFLVHSYPLYANNNDLARPIRLEVRPAFVVEWTKKLTEKWTFRSRFIYEYRIFQRNDGIWGDEQARTRVRLQMRYAWNPKNTMFISEEPLYNIPPNQPPNSFSQNQLYVAYNHAFTPHFSLETGYSWNHRQRATLIEFDEENVLQTHFIFRL